MMRPCVLQYVKYQTSYIVIVFNFLECFIGVILYATRFGSETDQESPNMTTKHGETKN